MTEEQKEIKRKAKEQTERVFKKLKIAAGGGNFDMVALLLGDNLNF
jgi:hypothetical protein